MASQQLQSSLEIHSLNHSVLSHLINRSPLAELPAAAGNPSDTNQHNDQSPSPPQVGFRPNALLSGTALILLNRPYQPDELAQLWTCSAIRVIVDGAVNRLFEIRHKGRVVDNLEMLPEINLSGIFPSRLEIETVSLSEDCPLPEVNQFSAACGHSDATGDSNCSQQRAQHLADVLAVHDITLTPLFPTAIAPDLVIGDLDSSHPLVLAYASLYCGTRVVRSGCQDTTDFQKALLFLRRHAVAGRVQDIINPRNLALLMGQPEQLGHAKPPATNAHFATSDSARALRPPSVTVHTCLCYNSFGGRFDQYMANVHTLYAYGHLFGRILLLGDGNVVQLLKPMTLINLDAFLPVAAPPATQHDLTETTTRPEEVLRAQQLDASTSAPSTTFVPVAPATTPLPQVAWAYEDRPVIKPHGKKVHCGVVPQTGPTRCSWLGLEWDLGDAGLNAEILAEVVRLLCDAVGEEQSLCEIGDTVVAVRDQTHPELCGKINRALESGVECGFEGLVSTNNWARPATVAVSSECVPIPSPMSHSAQRRLLRHYALFLCDKPMILSLSYAIGPQNSL